MTLGCPDRPSGLAASKKAEFFFMFLANYISWHPDKAIFVQLKIEIFTLD